MPVKGTTLFTLSTPDGIVMAADDLIYTEENGKPIPKQTGVVKVVVCDKVLIGSSGIMFCPPVEYEFKNWIADFIESQRGATDKRPNAIAEAVYAKMRTTFEPIDPVVKLGKWKAHGPTERLVSYVIAGYTKTFTKPYIYEVGVEVNAEGTGLRYLSPLHRPDNDLWIGEDQFFLRALNGAEPQSSFRTSTFDRISGEVLNTLPDIPEGLQDAIASVVSLIKVEAKFNPEKVGQAVNVVLIDRAAERVRLAIL